MEIIPDKRKLVNLVEDAYRGKLCLPNFQRDFVWSRDEVADLVRSVVRRYFVGSLLLLRCDPHHPPFAPAALRGAEPTFVDLKPDFLVLDGQQRLTSLMYALTAPDLGLKNSKQRRWLFVDLDALADDADDDGIVFDVTASERTKQGLDTPEGQYRLHKLPCTVLLNPQRWDEWKDGIQDWLAEHDPENLPVYKDQWRPRWTEAVHGFQSFEAPVVELPIIKEDDDDEIGRVCAIFEKLNSTGVELSVYDLLTARLYPHKVDLHGLWDEAVEQHPRLARWSNGSADHHKFGVLVLRVVALLRDVEPKPRKLINLHAKQFDEDWRRAAAAMDRALELVEKVGPDGFGSFEEKWLPYYGLLPVLAALRSVVEDRKLGEHPRADLRRWYWCNVFLERYSSSVEAKSRRDYTELVRYWTEGGPEPFVFGEARRQVGAAGSIRESASYASAVYSGVFCLLALNGARDWKFGEAIELQQLEDHHVFPQAYLTKRGLDSKKDKVAINTICNRTLISSTTNGTIKAKAPADYLDDPGVFPGGAAPELLGPHFLGEGAVATMRSATAELTGDGLKAVYERFCVQREAAILAAIRVACGIPAAATATPDAGDA